MNTDLGEELGSSWSVFVDGNETDSLHDMQHLLNYLGYIKTPIGFWKFWNAFGGDQGRINVERLPATCNIRMFRSQICLFEADKDPHLVNGGKWVVDCATQDIPRAHALLVMACVCENLSENIVGVVFTKNLQELSVSAWTAEGALETDSLSLQMTLGAICDGLEFKPGLSLNESVLGNASPEDSTNPDFSLKESLFKGERRKRIPMKKFKKLQSHHLASSIPPQLEEFSWNQVYQKNSSGGSDDKLMSVLGRDYSNYYDFELVSELNQARQNLLNAEGCVACGKQYDQYYTGKFLIFRCKLLHCQHVCFASEVNTQNINQIVKHYHCTSFFDVLSVKRGDPCMTPIPREPPGTKRNCSLRLSICHLLNNADILDINLGQEKPLCCLVDQRSGSEFLLVSFPNPKNPEVVEAAKKAGNYVGETFFKIQRARIVLKIKDDTKAYDHDANFDLTAHGYAKDQNFKLVFSDQHSGNKVTIGVIREELEEIGFVNIIKFVRYDFTSQEKHSAQAPYINVNIHAHSPMTMSPTAQENREDGYPNFPPHSPQDLNGSHNQRRPPPAKPVYNRSPRAHEHDQYDEMVAIHPDRLVCRTPPHPHDINMYNGRHNLSYAPSPSPFSHYSNPYGHGPSPRHDPMGGAPYGMPRREGPPMHEDRFDGMHPRHPDASPMLQYSPGRSSPHPRPPPHDGLGMDEVHPMYRNHLPPPRMGGMGPPGGMRGGKHNNQKQFMEMHADQNGSSKETVNVVEERQDTSFDYMPEPYHGREQEDENAISQLIGRVVYLAKSESGSRFVQEKVGNPRYLKIFFQEMKKRLPELMTDNFGHYAVETLFSHCTSNQRITLLQNLGPSLPNVACHKQGSFSVQSLINAVSSKEEIILIKDFLGRELPRIILSCPGHYVILRFISRFGWPCSNFVCDMLATNVIGFATDHYGLRVMKATFDSGTPGPKMDNLFKNVVENTNSLAENQYGNYIIQHLFDIGSRRTTDAVKQKMKGRYVRYAKQKFSSNVVEKCLKHSLTEYNDEQWCEIIVRELLNSAKELISDKYGNYCLQTALNTIHNNPVLVNEFITAVKPHLEALRVNVRNKWGKLLSVAQQSSNHHSPHSLATSLFFPS